MSEPTTVKPFKLNSRDLPWIPYAMGRFGSEDKDLTGSLNGRRIDCSLTRLAPGQVSTPYHFHHVGEEIFLILEGSGQLRYAGETHPIEPQDVICCPAGPEGAHQFINDGVAPLVYLAISTIDPAEICEYPDSGKLLAYSPREQGNLKKVFRTSDAVSYWDGEVDEPR